MIIIKVTLQICSASIVFFVNDKVTVHNYGDLDPDALLRKMTESSQIIRRQMKAKGFRHTSLPSMTSPGVFAPYTCIGMEVTTGDHAPAPFIA